MAKTTSDIEQAKGLLKGIIEQFGIDNVQRAAADCGIVDVEASDFLDSGVLDDEDDIPKQTRVDPDSDIDITPAYEPNDLYTLILSEEATKAALAIDPVKFNPELLVPLFLPTSITKDGKGNIVGVVDVTGVGARIDGCRYAKINLGGKQKVTTGGKEVTVGPEVTILLCSGEEAKAQAEIFKNAFDLSRLREMGGTTKPGGKAARVQVKIGWKKGNNPIRDTAKPNTWRAPDLVEKTE